MSVVVVLAIPALASAAGFSTFWYDIGNCTVKGVAKTYYENGSSGSSYVSVRGRWYGSQNAENFYQVWGPISASASGGGPREARVAHNRGSAQFGRVDGRHWGSPWGSSSYLTRARQPFIACGG